MLKVMAYATAHSSQNVPCYSTMFENMQIVPKNIWNDGVQDHVKDVKQLRTQTVCKKYPKVVVVVVVVVDDLSSCKLFDINCILEMVVDLSLYVYQVHLAH